MNGQTRRRKDRQSCNHVNKCSKTGIGAHLAGWLSKGEKKNKQLGRVIYEAMDKYTNEWIKFGFPLHFKPLVDRLTIFNEHLESLSSLTIRLPITPDVASSFVGYILVTGTAIDNFNTTLPESVRLNAVGTMEHSLKDYAGKAEIILFSYVCTHILRASKRR
uniref:Uncharacterized protein n=1 Tax=Glossina palpalis gambiensis TaxID=67801 RepID=A0A1B0AS05_9MUSC